MSNRKLQIVMTVDPEIPVPPLYYGGIERIVHMLVSGLVERGHQVHLFAHPESRVPAKLIPYQGKRSGSLKDTLLNALQIKAYVKKIGAVDIIHSFSRLAYLLLLMKTAVPKIQSYQRHVTPRSIYWGALLGGQTITFVGCSRYCAETANISAARWQVIPNGVSLAQYQFVPSVSPEAPLVFLGRLEWIKGPHTAIAVAKKSGRRLIIAGNHGREGKNYEYYVKEILPHCDNKNIQYIGPVDDRQKNELLGKAAALLFPIEMDEPFGIVMAEALACGVPVIAFKRGAVPEVIEDGVNGFVCSTQAEMVGAISRIKDIDRKKCREIAEKRFSGDVIVGDYLQLYERLINETRE